MHKIAQLALSSVQKTQSLLLDILESSYLENVALFELMMLSWNQFGIL